MSACTARDVAKFKYESMEGITTVLSVAGFAFDVVGLIPTPHTRAVGLVGLAASAVAFATEKVANNYRNEYDSLAEACARERVQPPTNQPGSLGGGGGGGGGPGGGYGSVALSWAYVPGSVTGSGSDVTITAGYWTITFKPIVLDLDGNGISYRSMQNPIFQDMTGDTRSELTTFVGPGDGMLVYDYNMNGIGETPEWVLTSFVPGAKSDLEALQAFDSNGDGRFSAADAEFAKFRIGVDRNQNGKFDAGELDTLAAHGIASLNLVSGVAAHGGAAVAPGISLAHSGQFTRTDGSAGLFHDAVLSTDRHGAVAYQDSVATIVNQGAANLFIYGGTAPLSVDLNHFTYAGYGNFLDVLGGTGNDVIQGNDNRNFLYGYGGADQLIGGGGDDLIVADAADLQYGLVRGGTGTDVLLLEGRVNGPVNASTLQVEVVMGDIGDDVITGAGTQGVMIGGGAGYDRVTGSDAGDVLFGGRGPDHLFGGLGDDIYLYDYGDGGDLVVDSGGTDKIIFDFTSDAVSEYRRDFNDVILFFGDGGSIRFPDNATSGGVEAFVFADATLSRAYVNYMTGMYGGGDPYYTPPAAPDFIA